LKVYDCFTFFNELDLLEIRLEELWDVVDYFVLAESNVTHTGMFKPLYFDLNKQRFEKYAQKIRHIVVDDMPGGEDNLWFRENHQRRCLARGLGDKSPDDLIIVTDADEIPRASVVSSIKHDSQHTRWILFAPQYLYKLNYMRIKTTNGVDWQAGPSIIVSKSQDFTDPQTERTFTFPWVGLPDGTAFVAHGGWHWSSLGNNQHCIQKINSFVHTNENIPEIVENFDIDRFIASKGSHHTPGQFFETVELNNYFPNFVLSNAQKFSQHVAPGLGVKTSDIYPFDTQHTYRT
jgi:hypothetical protein